MDRGHLQRRRRGQVGQQWKQRAARRRHLVPSDEKQVVTTGRADLQGFVQVRQAWEVGEIGP
jgi:hypothetical protein